MWIDVDECSSGAHNCQHGQYCNNRQGSFSCPGTVSFCVLHLLQSVITSVFSLHTVFFCIPYWLFQLCPNLFPRVSCWSDALADLMRIYKSKICTLVMVCIYNLIFSSPAVACGLQVDRSVGRPLQTLCTRLQWQRKKTDGWRKWSIYVHECRMWCGMWWLHWTWSRELWCVLWTTLYWWQRHL